MGRRFSGLRVVLFACVLLSLAGCGDLTGESPKIAKATPEPGATTASTAASATPAVTATAAPVASATPATAAEMTPDLPSATPASTPMSSAPSQPLTAPDPALAEAPGLFVREAQDFPVYWRTWTEDAFREAERRNVPVLLFVGSAWSHDSLVMDNKVFSDPEISSYINSNYMPVRVDADQRPDIWSRYRLAYEVINKELAKPPLVAFALPDGRPFDIIGSVPARSSDGSVGMLQLLTQADEMLKSKAGEVKGQADAVEKVLAQLLTAPRSSSVELSKDVVSDLSKQLQSAATGDDADSLRAGRVASFLLHSYASLSSDEARKAASELLLERFGSGQRDHVMGGYFFRIPGSGEIQFGKLLPVQSEMIEANARAYAVTGKGLHKEGVTEVLRFCRDWLEAGTGGFYTCQAPDIGPDDNGSYFTWSQDEINKITEDETATTVFCTYLNAKQGEKTNLHVTDRLSHAADVANVSYEQALKDLDKVRMKLHDARMSAQNVPMVDKSIIAGWNGDMICSYLDAARMTDSDKAREFAIKTADMIIDKMVSAEQGVARVMYKEQVSGYGYLADNVKVAAALLKCYEATEQKEYLESAQSLMQFVESRFLDKNSGLYQDVVISDPGQQMGLLKLKRLPLEDDISRSANAVAAMVWYRLYDATKNDEFKSRSERMVKAALQRRPFNTEATATWGEAALLDLDGMPKYQH